MQWPGAFARTITVNSTADTAADDGVCTLREAIAAANTNAASGAMTGECAAGEASRPSCSVHPVGAELGREPLEAPADEPRRCEVIRVPVEAVRGESDHQLGSLALDQIGDRLRRRRFVDGVELAVGKVEALVYQGAPAAGRRAAIR